MNLIAFEPPLAIPFGCGFAALSIPWFPSKWVVLSLRLVSGIPAFPRVPEWDA